MFNGEAFIKEFGLKILVLSLPLLLTLMDRVIYSTKPEFLQHAADNWINI